MGEGAKRVTTGSDMGEKTSGGRELVWADHLAPERPCSMALGGRKRGKYSCRWRHGELAGRFFGAGAIVGRPPSAFVRGWAARLSLALDEEWALRRPFLWLPAAAGAGAIFYLLAATEPVLWVVGLVTVFWAILAIAFRAKRGLSALFIGLAALGAGRILRTAGARRESMLPSSTEVSSANWRALSRKSIPAFRARASCCA